MGFLNYLVSICNLIEFLLSNLFYGVWGAEDRKEENVVDKVVIITGGNRGIGKELCLKMAKRGAIVVLACRNVNEGLKTLKEIQTESKSRKVVCMQLDLSDFESIRKFAKEVKTKYNEIHILINNAGICFESEKIQYTKNGHEEHMLVNHLGHFLLTNLLLENLKNGAPSRVVVISSTLSLYSELDLTDIMMKHHSNPAKRVPALMTRVLPYCNSKYANSLFAYELGERLKNTGVNVYSVCAGIAETNIFKHLSVIGTLLTTIELKVFGMSPRRAADSILYCALSSKCDNETGKFYRFEKFFTAGNQRLTSDAAKRLWLTSEALIRQIEDQSQFNNYSLID